VSEFALKQQRITALLAERRLHGLLLQRVSSFAWATCGAASYINTAATNGEAMLLITAEGRWLITNNVEAARLQRDPRIQAQGWDFSITPWYQAHTAVADLTGARTLGADGFYPGAVDLSADLVRLRSALTPEEGERFRALGRLCADALRDAVSSVQPGQTGYEIAARLAQEAERRGMQAVVNLVALDSEIFAYRHPLPGSRKLERYAMLILCGRREGLVCSITRLVHFGELPDNVRRKLEAVTYVDAALIDATRPGRSLGELFQRGIDAYQAVGFPDEWKLHHQGGLAGYEPREMIAVPGASTVIQAGQVYAWNPSITGTKSEDTVLIQESGCEILTAIDGWPALTVSIEGRNYQRPAILEIL
jgi:Xaa-Pro aminopeptidase